MVHAFALPGLQAEFAAELQQTLCSGLCSSRPPLFPGVLESPILLGCCLLLLPSQCLSPVLLLPPEACMAHAGHMLEEQPCHSKAWWFFFPFLFPSLLSSLLPVLQLIPIFTIRHTFPFLQLKWSRSCCSFTRVLHQSGCSIGKESPSGRWEQEKAQTHLQKHTYLFT